MNESSMKQTINRDKYFHIVNDSKYYNNYEDIKNYTFYNKKSSFKEKEKLDRTNTTFESLINESADNIKLGLLLNIPKNKYIPLNYRDRKIYPILRNYSLLNLSSTCNQDIKVPVNNKQLRGLHNPEIVNVLYPEYDQTKEYFTKEDNFYYDKVPSLLPVGVVEERFKTNTGTIERGLFYDKHQKINLNNHKKSMGYRLNKEIIKDFKNNHNDRMSCRKSSISSITTQKVIKESTTKSDSENELDFKDVFKDEEFIKALDSIPFNDVLQYAKVQLLQKINMNTSIYKNDILLNDTNTIYNYRKGSKCSAGFNAMNKFYNLDVFKNKDLNNQNRNDSFSQTYQPFMIENTKSNQEIMLLVINNLLEVLPISTGENLLLSKKSLNEEDTISQSLFSIPLQEVIKNTFSQSMDSNNKIHKNKPSSNIVFNDAGRMKKSSGGLNEVKRLVNDGIHKSNTDILFNKPRRCTTQHARPLLSDLKNDSNPSNNDCHAKVLININETCCGCQDSSFVTKRSYADLHCKGHQDVNIASNCHSINVKGNITRLQNNTNKPTDSFQDDETEQLLNLCSKYLPAKNLRTTSVNNTCVHNSRIQATNNGYSENIRTPLNALRKTNNDPNYKNIIYDKKCSYLRCAPQRKNYKVLLTSNINTNFNERNHNSFGKNTSSIRLLNNYDETLQNPRPNIFSINSNSINSCANVNTPKDELYLHLQNTSLGSIIISNKIPKPCSHAKHVNKYRLIREPVQCPYCYHILTDLNITKRNQFPSLDCNNSLASCTHKHYSNYWISKLFKTYSSSQASDKKAYNLYSNDVMLCNLSKKSLEKCYNTSINNILNDKSKGNWKSKDYLKKLKYISTNSINFQIIEYKSESKINIYNNRRRDNVSPKLNYYSFKSINNCFMKKVHLEKNIDDKLFKKDSRENVFSRSIILSHSFDNQYLLQGAHKEYTSWDNREKCLKLRHLYEPVYNQSMKELDDGKKVSLLEEVKKCHLNIMIVENDSSSNTFRVRTNRIISEPIFNKKQLDNMEKIIKNRLKRYSKKKNSISRKVFSLHGRQEQSHLSVATQTLDVRI